MSEPFIGEIRTVGFNFAPRGWALCNGQLLSISSNTALFSLLGTTYGGDGRTTFGLPNLQSRVPMHVGTGPGLSPVSWGQTGGAEDFTLNAGNLPPHTHGFAVPAATEDASEAEPAPDVVPATPGDAVYAPAADTDTTIAAGTTTSTGNGQSVTHRVPYVGMYYVIATTGIFPSRS